MTQSPNKHYGRSRLYRDPENGVLMGVCAGLADHFGISVVGVRIAAFLGLIFFFVPVACAYLIMGFFLKPKPPGLYATEEEESFWRRTRVDPKRTVSDIQQRFREIERRIRNAEAYVTSSEFKLKRDFKEI
jgi:phage shock protein C